jgi:antitoxin ParD1/3/4
LRKNRKKLNLIPIIGIFDKIKIMARNTSILLGDYFENFINEQISTGKYSSVSEVVRTALRVFEQEEIKTKSLINELKIGEKSSKIRDFDRNKNLEMLKANFQK